VQVRFNHQSIQINKGIVHADGVIGAGDQGLMFGYACDETPDLMPYPIWLAHRLVARQAELRSSGALPWLRPDAKSQVTVRYEGQRVAGVNNVIISTQIERNLDPAQVAADVTREIIDPLLPAHLRMPEFRIWVNPAGPFEIGGPNGDTGLTGPQDHRRYLRRRLPPRRRRVFRQGPEQGRPLGGLHGALRGEEHRRRRPGAALHGATGLRHRRRRAGIGDGRQPGHGKRAGCRARSGGEKSLPPDAQRHHRQPRPGAAHLPPTAAYGHFGRGEAGFTWERTDRVDALRVALG
jgi:hypothetical protein